MDDQRPQRPWETNKKWLEDHTRSSAALSGIETFAKQAHFVRRRGQVSKMCFFETADAVKADQTLAKAAYQIARAVEHAAQEVLQAIPINLLAAEGNSVRIPS